MVITASADYYKFQNCCFDIVLLAQKSVNIVEKVVALKLLCREKICNIAV